MKGLSMQASNSRKKPVKLIFLTGPTGVGKSNLSLKIAKAIGAEIISMDSMQIYRGMDIGTDKLRVEDRQGIAHHMIDIVDPGQRFTSEDYQQMAYQKIGEIISRGHVPMFVGGTGLYLDAVIHDFQFANINISPDLRKKLKADYEKDGGKSLYDKLKEVDPEAYQNIHISEKKKIVRALEVYYSLGQTMSSLKNEQKTSPLWDPLIFILDDDREKLYEKINLRVDQMMDQGLEEENLNIYDHFKNHKSQAFQAIGYREFYWYFRGIINRAELIELIKRFSRNYAKRQQTWFKRYDKAFRYSKSLMSEGEILEDILGKIDNFLEENDVKEL